MQPLKAPRYASYMMVKGFIFGYMKMAGNIGTDWEHRSDTVAVGVG
jgi:hypothetical protein